MTILEAVTRADGLRPNAVALGEKVRWLSDLDGMALCEIMAGHEGAPKTAGPYLPEGGLQETLLIPEPYSDLYIKYLLAQLDYAQGEYEGYNNSMVMFNIALSAFADHYNRTHLALNRGNVRL